MQNGYVLPDNVSEEQYYYTKQHKDEDEVLTGFIGFGVSFGGRFFEGYARSHTEKRNYAKTAKQSLLRDKEKLKDVVFTCMDYKDVVLPEGCIIYADPPYYGTKQIGNKKFDTQAFWEYAREVSKTHLMFISELSAPDDFISIWHKEITRTLDVNKNNQFKATENLFIHKDYINIV